MNTMPYLNALAKRSLLLCLFLFAPLATLLAQGSKAAYFNKAVDEINCATITFIHREAGRAEVANNLDCTSFEAILKSIPADEAKTTASVCKDIEAFKNKYKEGKPLEAQIDAVVKYAYGKISAKKRKGNVEDFKSKLETYKAEALKDAGDGPAASAGSASTPAGDASPAITSSDTATSQTSSATKSGSGKNWLGWISLLLSLASLGISVMAYRRSASAKGKAGMPEGARRSGNPAEESMAMFKKLENKLYEETNRLTRAFDDKLAAITASTGYTAPEDYTRPAPEEKPAPAPAPAVPPQPAPVVPPRTQEPERVVHVLDEDEEMDTDEDEDEPHYTSPLSHDMPEPSAGIGYSASQSTGVAPMSSDMHEDEEDENGEGEPFFKYAGIVTDGGFAENTLTESPMGDSVFEIEMYEDVPNKAFFSLLPYPEVIRRALSDPDKYLLPCCSYADDPSGKRTIVLLEEGTLRKQGNKWLVYEKARIRFE